MSALKKLFLSIRIKIILLSILGILGMVMIAGVYKYLDYTETAYQIIGKKSHEIIRATDRQALIEERFIATGKEALTQEHKDLEHRIIDGAESIKNLTGSDDITLLADNILNIGKQQGAIFKSVINNVFSINETQATIIEKLATIRAFIEKAIAEIEREAAELIYEGEVLDSSKSTLLIQLKDFISLWNLRLINIQELFILQDKERYEASKTDINRNVTNKKKDINTVMSAVEDAVLIDLWKKVSVALPEVDAMEATVASLWENNQTLKLELEALASKAQDTALGIEKSIDEIITDRSRTGDIVSLIVTVSCISILVVLGIVILKTIIKPITNTVRMIRDIAEGEGDLTRQIELNTENEIGEMVHWFNVFIDNIRNIVKEVFQNASQLNESSGGLASISEQMSHGAEDTSSKANSVAAASEEMSANITSVASVMEQASTNMNMVASAAEEMNATINEIAQNTEKAKTITNAAVDQADNASHQVDELGNAAHEIGKVIETITEISEQVNLLALNATIEAARAGEAGKGFAVVANEIKELARQTAEATGEIKQRVEGIQGSTETTVGEINNITKVVNEVNDIVTTIATAVEEQSVTTKEIAGNVNQASTGITEANDNVAQSSRVSSDIANEIAQVTQSANEMSNSSSQVNMSSVELSKLAETLNEMVGRFKV